MISVALCTFNGSKYLEIQLQSIVDQSLVPDEIVIGDDGSTDDTLGIVEKFVKKYNNISWKIIQNNQRLGFCRNFLKTMKLCNGDYVFLSDQDDIWHKDKIMQMVDSMKYNHHINALFSSYECIDSENNRLSFNYRLTNSIVFNLKSKLSRIVKYDYESFIKSMNIAGMSVCLKKEFIDRFLALNVDGISYHDTFICFFASLLDSLYFFNKALVQYRMHDNNQIGLDNAKNIVVDRIEWIKGDIAVQKELMRFAIVNNLDNEKIENLNQVIEFNNKRCQLLDSLDLFSLIKLIYIKKYYKGFFSYLGDIVYILRNEKSKKEENNE